jgi:hypothetical protein
MPCSEKRSRRRHLLAALGVAQEEIATDDVWITERTDRQIAVVAMA